MNQVDIWFSILYRRVLEHGDFATPERQRWQVDAFTQRWNRIETTSPVRSSGAYTAAD